MTYRVKNWTQFQHYKDRRPPWIKLHRTLLDDCDFLRLPVASRALAPLLWLLASESQDGVVSGQAADVAFRLRLSDKEVTDGIKGLCEGGYITAENDASAMLAPCKQDTRLETETEAEGEKERETEAAGASVPVVVKPQSKHRGAAGYTADFERVWSAYGCHGTKARAARYWDRLNDADRLAVEAAIPAYLRCVAADRSKKDMDGWLNPDNRMWENNWDACLIALNRKNAQNSGKPNPHVLSASQRANMTREEIDAHNAKHGIIEDR